MPDNANIAEEMPNERCPDKAGNTPAQSPEASEFAYSCPFNIHWWSEYPEVDQAVELVTEQIRIHKLTQRFQKKHKQALKVVILGLYSAWLTDPRLYLGYSRRTGYYKVSSRYNSLEIGSGPLLKVIDALTDLGFIKHKNGFKDRDTGIGFQSRMLAKQPFIDLIVDDAGLRPEMLGTAPNNEVIVLRNKDDNDKQKNIEYPDTPETEILRFHARFINQFLARHIINLRIPDAEFPELVERIKGDPGKEPVDFTRTQLRRIFSNGSFEKGGRFYGGWWQQVPSEYRRFITINGKRTVEIDYSTLHPRMLYARVGIKSVPGDLYDIPVPGIPPAERRGVVKGSVNTLLNAETEDSAIGAIREDYPEYRNAVEDIVTAIKKHHRPIERFFHTGIGLELQYLDATLAQEVILFMAERYGVLVLPVHDSFIVRTGYDEELRTAMEELFQGLFPNTAFPPPLSEKAIDEGVGEVTTGIREILTKWRNTHAWEERLRTRANAAMEHSPVTPRLHTKWK